MFRISKKKKIIPVFVAVICIVALISAVLLFQTGSGYDYSQLVGKNDYKEGVKFTAVGSSDLQGMEKAAENDILELFINPKTTEVAVRDKRNQKVWYTNPVDRDTDPQANKSEKERLSSQVSVQYFDPLQRENSFYSFADSVEKNQFELYSIENGVRVVYTMGDLSLGAARLPKYITPQRLEEKILSKLDKEKRNYFKRKYVESKKAGYMEIISKNLESDIIVNKLTALLDEAGYTEKDLEYDNQQSGYVNANVKPFVKIPLNFTLQGDKLSVNIPVSKIEYEKSITLSGIDLMNWFGAGSKNDKGYMVVPSGSGGIIHFNNGKQKEDPYLQPVYGTDTVLLPGSQMQSSQTTRLPIYGIKNGNAAFLAYIDKGASVASIAADVSGRKNSYNCVYPKFSLRSFDTISMSGLSDQASDMKIIEKNSYQGDITVHYGFLDSDQADYAGMAKYYQNVLVQEGTLNKKEKADSKPFYLDLLGAIQKEKITLGYPHQTLTPLTTYTQANVILDALEREGISTVQLRYQGWFNDGVNHNVAKVIRPDKVVGDVKELRKLEQRLQEKNGALYPDVAFQLVAWNTDHYSSSKEAARSINGQSAVIAPYNPAFLHMASEYPNAVSFINSPNALPNQVTSFLKEYSKLSLNNVSLRDMGDILSSDKNKKRPIDREVSMLIAQEQMKRISTGLDSVMVSGGNKYSIAFADHLVNIPTSADQYYIIDDEIPFYEMVLHGYVDYTGTPVNVSKNYDKQQAILKMAEYAYAPHFLWTYENTAELVKTPLDGYYSTDYRDWLSAAKEFNDVANDVVYPVRNAKVVKHKILENGLREIEYDNHISVYVNYTDKDLSADGMTIAANSYYTRR